MHAKFRNTGSNLSWWEDEGREKTKEESPSISKAFAERSFVDPRTSQSSRANLSSQAKQHEEGGTAHSRTQGCRAGYDNPCQVAPYFALILV